MEEMHTIKAKNEIVIYDLNLTNIEVDGIINDASLILTFCSDKHDKKFFIPTLETKNIYNKLKEFFKE